MYLRIEVENDEHEKLETALRKLGFDVTFVGWKTHNPTNIRGMVNKSKCEGLTWKK